jgi:hypothetical protein
MPDGDRIHTNLGARYQKIYKQICEDHFPTGQIAHNFLLPFKEEIQHQGSEIIELISKCAAQCDQILIEQEIGNEINWDKENLVIEKRGQRIYARNTAKELAIAACKEQLQEIRHTSEDSNFPVEIMRKYLWNLYVAKFSSKVPLKKQHYNGVDNDIVNARLAEMKQHIQESLLDFAKQAVRHNSFDSLRRPPRRRQKFTSDNLDIDLTTLAG